MKARGGVFPEGLGTSASLCRAHPLRTGAPNSSREISGTVTVTSSHLLARYCHHPLSEGQPAKEQRRDGKTPPQQGPRRKEPEAQTRWRQRRRGQVSRLTSEAQEKEADRKEGLQRPEHLDSPQRPASHGPCTCSKAGAPFSLPPVLFSTGTGSRTASSRMSPLISSRHFIPPSQVGGFHAALFCAG